MISKELLSEVLITVREVTTVNEIGYSIIYWSGISVEGGLCNGYMNIHELAYKCKEWILEKEKVYIWSGWNKDDEMWSAMDGSQHINYFVADTEPEAIFQACECIFKELNNQ